MITHAMLGSWPGTDPAATSRMVLGECPEHATLPELPARGPHAGMIGRAVALLDGLGADLQPTGWRLTDAAGVDHRRARTTLGDDRAIFAEQAQGFTGEIVLTAAGPWTLIAHLELARGTKVLADPGARRDVAQALASGLTDHAAALARLVPTASVRLQLDEPMLPAVAHGTVRTASGFARVAPIDVPELETTLGDLIARTGTATAGHVTLHCCAPGFDPGLARRVGADAVSLDLSTNDPATRLDGVAAHLDAGGLLWWGIAPTARADTLPRPDALLARALRVVRPLEMPASVWLDQTVLTPACGLAGWGPGSALALLRLLRRVATDLSEEIGSR